MKHSYQSVLFSLCTIIFTSSNCTTQKLELIKDTSNTSTTQDDRNNQQKKPQIEESKNSITEIEEDGCSPINIKLIKNTNPENNIPQSDLTNEQKKTEPEVEENKFNETPEKKTLSKFERILREGMPNGRKHLTNLINFILEDIKGSEEQKLYTSYYLSTECKIAKDEIDFLIKHYDVYLEALTQWCLTLPSKAQEIFSKKIDNSPDGISLEKVCMALAPDAESKKNLADLRIKDINNQGKHFTDFMGNQEILSKMPKNIQKLILNKIKTYKNRQQEGLENLKRISLKNTGNAQFPFTTVAEICLSACFRHRFRTVFYRKRSIFVPGFSKKLEKTRFLPVC